MTEAGLMDDEGRENNALNKLAELKFVKIMVSKKLMWKIHFLFSVFSFSSNNTFFVARYSNNPSESFLEISCRRSSDVVYNNRLLYRGWLW